MNILDEAKTARRMKVALRIKQKVMEADRETGARTPACVRWRKGQSGQKQQEKQNLLETKYWWEPAQAGSLRAL